MIPHDIPSAPWVKLATDIFSIDKDDLLVVMDFHSTFHIVRRLQSIKNLAVTEIMSDIFGMFGIPSEKVSDNGTQYTGEAFQTLMEKYKVKPTYPQLTGRKDHVYGQKHYHQPATVSRVCKEPRSYVVSTPNGGNYRNR